MRGALPFGKAKLRLRSLGKRMHGVRSASRAVLDISVLAVDFEKPRVLECRGEGLQGDELRDAAFGAGNRGAGISVRAQQADYARTVRKKLNNISRKDFGRKILGSARFSGSAAFA